MFALGDEILPNSLRQSNIHAMYNDMILSCHKTHICTISNERTKNFRRDKIEINGNNWTIMQCSFTKLPPMFSFSFDSCGCLPENLRQHTKITNDIVGKHIINTKCIGSAYDHLLCNVVGGHYSQLINDTLWSQII